MGCPDARLFLDAGLPDDFFADAARAFPSWEGAPLRILWVGRLLPRKGLRLTLDILARVRVPFTLTILGSGMAEEEVRAQIRERGLEQQVLWKPERVPWEEVRRAYAAHDCLLFNSLRDSFGAQLLEAMAAGLPIVCLATSGARDFVPQAAGIKVPVHSAEQVVADMAAAIERFAAAPPALRSRMSAAALDAARNHSWRKRAACAHEMYTELLTQARTAKADRRILFFPANTATKLMARTNPARKGFGG